MDRSVRSRSGRILGILLDIVDELGVVVIDHLVVKLSEMLVHGVLGLEALIAHGTGPLELLLGLVARQRL